MRALTVEEHRSKTPEQKKSYAVLQIWRATKRGTLIPPSTCSKCGRDPGRGSRGQRLIQAHHYRGYEMEQIFDVEWLCPSCHKIVDASFGWTADRREEQSRRMKGQKRDLTPEQRRRFAESCRRTRPWEGRYGK